MKPIGKTTRKHRRQQANGKPRHRLIGGRTGGKSAHQLMNFKRGKAAKASGKARNEVVSKATNPPPSSAAAYSIPKQPDKLAPFLDALAELLVEDVFRRLQEERQANRKKKVAV